MNQQYSNTQDVSGTNAPFMDTKGQDAFHLAMLLQSQQMNPNGQNKQSGSSGMNTMDLAKMLKNKPSQPSNQNPATIHDYSTQYDPSQYTGIDEWLAGGGGQGGMNDYLGNLGLDGGGSFSGAGDFSLGNAFDGLSGFGDFFGGAGDWLGGIGDWFAGIDWAGLGAGAGEIAAEAAPVAVAAA